MTNLREQKRYSKAIHRSGLIHNNEICGKHLSRLSSEKLDASLADPMLLIKFWTKLKHQRKRGYDRKNNTHVENSETQSPAVRRSGLIHNDHEVCKRHMSALSTLRVRKGLDACLSNERSMSCLIEFGTKLASCNHRMMVMSKAHIEQDQCHIRKNIYGVRTYRLTLHHRHMMIIQTASTHAFHTR